MTHIESSTLIKLAVPVEASLVKHTLIERMRRAFNVQTVGDDVSKFEVMFLGQRTLYRCDLNVLLRVDDQYARVVVDGRTRIRASTMWLYAMGFLMLLILGLFPGILNTSGRGSSAVDILVFLFLGAFLLYDIHKKLLEPEILLDRILQALNAEFGK